MNKLLKPAPFKINPPLIAHRGASAYAPENTVAAFKKAKALGAQWIEFDVMLAACGEVVVFHDENLERTTNGSGQLHDYPYAQLKTLDAGSWFGAQFAGERIPSLKEVLEFLEQNPLSANIEIKAIPGMEKETVTRVLALLDRYWPKAKPAPLLSSFSMEVLSELRAQSTSCLLGFLMGEVFLDWEKMYLELQASSLNFNEALLGPALIKTLKASGGLLLAYTVNDPARALELFSWGVDAVFTDCPDKILAVVSG